MKFQTLHGIGVVIEDQPAVRTCYVHLVRRHVLKTETLSIQIKEYPREERSRLQPVGEDKGNALRRRSQGAVNALGGIQRAIPWKPNDMTGISEVIVHELNIYPSSRLIAQKGHLVGEK